MNKLLRVILWIGFLAPEIGYSQDYAYGAYGLFPQGSIRVLAMGGAFSGLSDDASAINFNPAGLAMAKFKYDIQSGENRIINKEIELYGISQKVGVPYNFSFTSGVFKWGNLVLGGGYSRPFDMNPKENGSVSVTQSLKVESYETILSYKFSSNWAFGVTLHYERAAMAYEDVGTSGVLESESTAIYPTVGMSYRSSQKLGMGISYSSERRYDLDESLNSTLYGQSFFRDVVIPSKLTIGGFYRLGGRLILVLDADFIGAVKNAVYIHDSSATPQQTIIEEDVNILHGGYEMEVIKNQQVEFIWRGGGYIEPNRFLSATSRPHFTMGVEFRFGPIAVASSYDQAEDFSNIAHSLSFKVEKL